MKYKDAIREYKFGHWNPKQHRVFAESVLATIHFLLL